MQIKLVYFASVREQMGSETEVLTLPDEVDTVSKVIEYLCQRLPAFSAMHAATPLLQVAVNQSVGQPETAVVDQDEVAFFPPVTGG